MTKRPSTPSPPLLLYSQEHECPYLPGNRARTLFVDPSAPKDLALYSQLIDHGFRRSGKQIYRPSCHDCQACIALRLPVARFQPRRNHRRSWQRNEPHMQVSVRPPVLEAEHFELYVRYMAMRHPEGHMGDTTSEECIDFLACDWCETRFVEFRLADRLMAVAVIDLLPQGLSAVYTFFDPELSRLSPGTLAVLWQIHKTRHDGLPWLYLGYWIPGCRKMAYKAQYRPVQVYSQGRWQEFGPGEHIQIPEIPNPR